MWMRVEKGIRAIDRHAAKIDRRRPQAKQAVATLDHVSPPIVEERRSANLTRRSDARPIIASLH
jgi:hypothetical protein